MSEIKFSIPLKAFVRTVKKTGKDKYFAMNLNQYRNTHHSDLGKSKINYHQQIKELIPAFSANIIHIDYTIYTKTKSVFDVNNIASILDKYLCDVIVSLGYIPDDNYNHIPELPSGRYGGKDKDYPRADVIIKIIK